MGGTRLINLNVNRCVKLNEVIAQYEQAPEASRADLASAVDEEYWCAAAATAEAYVAPDLPREITLRPVDCALFSFGIPENDKFKARTDAALAAMKQQSGEFAVRYMHERMALAYRDALRLETLARLRRKLESIDKELDDWPDAHLEHVKLRDRLVSEALGGTQAEQDLLLLYSELDERMEHFKFMERQNQNQGFSNSDERRDWRETQQYIQERVEAVDAMLEPLARQAGPARAEIGKLEVAAAQAQPAQAAEHRGKADTLRGAHAAVLAAEALVNAANSVSDSFDRLLDLRNEHRLVEAQILDEENTVHQITQAEVTGHLLNEIGNVRSMLRLAARYARVRECAVPLDNQGVAVEPEAVQQALNEIQEFDPYLFANAGARRFGKPEVVLAPGLGDGVFDSDHNRLVIPLRTLKTPLESVARAAVLYRLEMDAAYGGRRLFRSYQAEMRGNTENRSNLRLRQELTRDYLAWLTREARGESVLGPQALEWFEKYVAPPKHHPMLPREYVGLSARQLHQKLEDTDRGHATGDREYRVALLQWLLDPADTQTLNEKVLPRIENALQLGPDSMACLYSAAALHLQAGNTKRAGELFSRYADEARVDWWCRKAAEFAEHCQSTAS